MESLRELSNLVSICTRTGGEGIVFGGNAAEIVELGLDYRNQL